MNTIKLSEIKKGQLLLYGQDVVSKEYILRKIYEGEKLPEIFFCSNEQQVNEGVEFALLAMYHDVTSEVDREKYSLGKLDSIPVEIDLTKKDIEKIGNYQFRIIKKGRAVKEIFGGRLETVMTDLNLDAIKTYEGRTEYWESLQVWEPSEEDLKKLLDVQEEEWNNKEYGWFRISDGSNMGSVSRRYKINGYYIKAWDADGFRYYRDRTYKDLLSYFSEELGASQPRNVCALAIDLAKQNGMKLSELFKKYQG
jgi:hypothetical protein